MSKLNHDDIIALIPAYALGTLDVAEAKSVTRHLRQCAACRAELDLYRQVTDELALAAPDAAPDPQLKQRLMARIGQQEETAVSPSSTAGPLALLRRWLGQSPWQPALLLIFILLLVGNLLLWQRSPEEPLPGRQIVLTSTDVAPQARAMIHISENGRWGTLIVEDLPPLPEDQQYQLWLIKNGERDSGGIFSVPDHGYYTLSISAPETLNSYNAFGVTIEPFGGSTGPTGRRVLSTTP